MPPKERIATRNESAVATAGTNILGMPLNKGTYLLQVQAVNNTKHIAFEIYLVDANIEKIGHGTTTFPSERTMLQHKSPPPRIKGGMVWSGRWKVPEGDWYVEAGFHHCDASDDIKLKVVTANHSDVDMGKNMGIIPVASHPLGEVKDNYSTATLVNNTQMIKTIYTCPTGYEAYIFFGHIENGDNVARTMGVVVKNSSDELIGRITYASVPAGEELPFPNQKSDDINQGGGSVMLLKQGDYIEASWNAGGASAGGAAPHAVQLKEVHVR